MNWELLDDGSWNGVRKWIRGLEDDSVDVMYEDVSGGSVIEENKQAEGYNPRDDAWHVGHIPASVGLKWLVEEGLDMWNPDHRKGVMKRLMDSDYRHLVPGMKRIIL